MNQPGYGGAPPPAGAGTEAPGSTPGPQPTTQLPGYPPQALQPPQQPYYQQPAAPQPGQRPTHSPHRLPIIGPVLLIGAGLLFLLNNLGVVDWSIWDAVLRLWPLALILLGIDMLVGRRNPVLTVLLTIGALLVGVAFLLFAGGITGKGDIRQQPLSVPLGDAKSASVMLQIGAGDLIVGAGNGSALASGTLDYYEQAGTPSPDLSTDSDGLSLRLQQPNARWSLFGSGGHTRWLVNLSPSPQLRLDAHTGAGTTTLNLEQLRVSDLSLETGAGEASVTFPGKAGRTTASIDGGAGNLHVVIPQGVGSLIKVDTGVGNVTIDSRFAKQGEEDTYKSGDYSTAANRLDLDINVGVGSLDILSGSR